LYVDGFNVAAQLRSQNPDAYNTLSTLRIPTHCAGDDNVMILQHPGRPILNHCPVTGDLEQVRFNNDDRSPLSTFQNGANDVLSFYAALRAWTRLLRNSANEMWVQLRPGIVVAMDNWRVLHGRSAFTGYRRMAGSYHSHDDYRSRVRTICYGREGFGL
jgi:trimethyllysine dioxygenase